MKALQFNFIVLFIFFISFNITAQDAKQQKEIINKLNEIHKPTFKTRDSLATIYKVIYEKISYTSDTIIKNNLFNKINELDIIAAKNATKELENEFTFVKRYPSNPISLELLLYKVTKNEASNFYEVFNTLFTTLSLDLQNSSKGIQLKNALVNFEKSNIGSQAPDFTVKDIRNNTINLANYKNNKYVLLSFWKSTSQVCIDENIVLNELYSRYSQNDLEIITVSLDDNMEVLRKAIDSQKIEKFTTIPLLTNDIPLLENYFVNSIPQKILIDKNGIILARWRGSNHTIKKEINLMFSNLFKTVVSSKTVH